MPLYGTRDISSLAAEAPLLAAYNAEPLRLPGVSVLQAMFELREGAMVNLLPPALHPTIPPIVIFVITSVPESPVGPFVLAEARVGCRAAARPRGFLPCAFVTTAPARELLRSRWAYPASLAEVVLERGYDRVRGFVSVDGSVVLDVALMNPEAVSGGDIQYLATMNLARVRSGGVEQVRLVQVDPEFEFLRADRGRPRLDAFAPLAWALPGADPWWPVSASLAVADMELPSIRYVVDPLRPATEGLERVG